MALFKGGKPAQQPMSFEEKCEVLGDLWLNYREEAAQDEGWSQFFSFADIGLPMAYTLSEELVSGATEEAISIIDETWDSFCDLLSLDAQGHYESLEDMFNRSPQPALDLEEPSPAGQRDDPKDHGLEGFMGRRVPDRERTLEHGLEGFMGRETATGSGYRSNGSAAASGSAPDITVTKSAWREIGSQCRASGMHRSQVRLHVLPCQCGGRHWGLSLDDAYEKDDVRVSNGSETIVLDPVSAKNARRTQLDAEGRGGNFVFSMSDSKFCDCGNNWRPTLAVAAMAVTFGVVKRNIAIANGWLQENSGQADTAASSGADYSDSGGSDYEYDFDFGGF